MHRELFSIGAFKVHSYGFMLCIAFILGLLITYRHLKKNFIDPYVVFDIVIAALVGGIVGARIFYILGNLDEFRGHWGDILHFWDMSGLVFFGGLLLGGAAVIAVIRWKGLPFPIVADGAGLSLALGLAVTRIGCFLNGCCYGKPSGLPWAVTFPSDSGIYASMNIAPTPIHPTQIYESLLDLALFIFLMVIRKRLKYHGEIFYLFLALYGLIRFSVEFFRYHTNASADLTFQIMSLSLTVGAGLVLLFRARLLPEVRP
jgi:phosphatidylglycerol:prolipoprotein diacylglycerol transferase